MGLTGYDNCSNDHDCSTTTDLPCWDNYFELGVHFLNILQTAIESLDFHFHIYIDSLTGEQV